MKRLLLGILILVMLISLSIGVLACASQPSEPPQTNHLVFTMTYDETPCGSSYSYSYCYYPGDRVDIFFQENNRFTLDPDAFDGSYSIKGKTLSLNFDGYSPWIVTFNTETTFTGEENGYKNAGTYRWLTDAY